MTVRTSSIAILLLLLAACQSPDVGQRCQFGMAGVTPSTAEGDYFENGNTECDALICIVSPDSQTSSPYSQCVGTDPVRCGYCSKPCTADKDCFPSQTGLRCRQMFLDPLYIAQLQQTPEGQALLKYLGGIEASSFCAVPLPPAQ